MSAVATVETRRAGAAGRCTRRRVVDHSRREPALARGTCLRGPCRNDAGVFPQVTLGASAGSTQRACRARVNNDPVNKSDPTGLRVCDYAFSAMASAQQLGASPSASFQGDLHDSLSMCATLGAGTEASAGLLECAASAPGLLVGNDGVVRPEPVNSWGSPGSVSQADYYFGYLGGGTCADASSVSSSTQELVETYGLANVLLYGSALTNGGDCTGGAGSAACIGLYALEMLAAGCVGAGGYGVCGGRPGSSKPTAMTCGANSFTGGTDVHMSDGSTKDIEDVDVGDIVWAADPETGERGPREVVALIIGQGTKHLVDVTLAGGGTVTATDAHPFWVDSDGEWVDAADLQPGDVLLTPDGVTRVDAVEHRTETATVYNLTVADIHTYHVLAGDDPVLVHNCAGMMGENGTQTVSKTLMKNSNYHIDVENPAPGRRAGQLHLQDYAGNKYQYDVATGRFTGLSGQLARQVASDAAVTRAIATGLRYLGM